MTVHELPTPADVGLADERRTRNGRIKMLLLLLVCMAPVLASYLTYYVIRPELGTRNHAELISPPRDLPQATARDLDGHEVPLASLKGQWLIVAVAAAACDEQCQKNLYFQRQLREMQGKEKERIDRVWLLSDDGAVPQALLPALRQATVLRVAPEVLRDWLAPAAGHALPDHLYLIDPMGNWMMRLPPHIDVDQASRVKRDIERLLRASSSWDNAGR